MTVYEFMKMSDEDYDVADNTFDASVTICMPYDDDDDAYSKFIIELTKKVQVVSHGTVQGYGYVVADWTKLINDNWSKFKRLTKKYWKHDYEDDDDFRYEWINELHYYCAGYTYDEMYEELYKAVKSMV